MTSIENLTDQQVADILKHAPSVDEVPTETLDELALDAECDVDPTAPMWAPYVAKLAARGPREVNAAIASVSAARRSHLRRGMREAAANNTATLVLYRAARERLAT